MFDLSTNSPTQRAIINSALAKCDFDFTRLAPKLRNDAGRTHIPVTWEDLTAYNARGLSGVMAVEDPRHHDDHDHGGHRRATLGLAYYSGRIVIEQRLTNDPELAEVIFLAEAAHMVDFFLITPEQRARLYELFHEPGDAPHDHGWFETETNQNYWDFVGEAWMYGFIKAFTDLEPGWGGMRHHLTDADALEVRQLLGAKTPEPESVPVCALRWGYAFHRPRAHWWLLCTRNYRSRDAAIADGLRPCKLCKP